MTLLKMIPRKFWILIVTSCIFGTIYLLIMLVYQNNNNSIITINDKAKELFASSTRSYATILRPFGTNRPPFQTSIPVKLLDVADVPDFRAHSTDCAALFAGDKIHRYLARFNYVPTPVPNRDIIAMTKDCKKFIRRRKYIMNPVSREEFLFPIAFSILIYKDAEQFERLLRAIYRPQNIYCVHVDKKSSESFKATIDAIVDCFDNVFITSRSVSVEWGYYSVLEPELICMEELWNRSKKWRYFINLTGQEFPLKTNGDIVKILQVFNGANNVEGTVLRQSPELRSYLNNPPFGMTIAKGSVHITASRGFVDYILHNSSALEFHKWIKDKPVPDELFFSSLNHNPSLGVPGAYKGVPETDTRKNLFITRFKNWGTWPFIWPCYGKWVRQICVFGVGDLPLLGSRPELFANKFHSNFQPLAQDCVEERHYNLTRAEVLGERTLDLDFYRELDFVQNHV